MRLQILFAISLIFVTTIAVFSQVKVTSKDIRIISSSYSNFSSGTALQQSEGVRGIQYEVKAVIKSKEGVVIDSLVTEQGVMSVETVVGLRRAFTGTINKGDTVQIIARTGNEKAIRSLSTNHRQLLHKSLKNKSGSLILYRIKERRCAVAVQNFTKKTIDPNQ